MGKGLMKFQVYVVPVPLTALLAYGWYRWSGSAPFAWYVTLLAIVYGYVVPGIGTNLLKKWRFLGPGRLGDTYVHHGFIWAANLSPALFLCFLGTPAGPLGVGTIIRVLLGTGAIHAYKGWIYDTALIRHGFAEVYNKPGLAGQSPEQVVAHYVPLCFFLIGLTYALGGLVAYHQFVVLGRTGLHAHLVAWGAGWSAMVAIPSLAYRYLEFRDGRRQGLWASRRGERPGA